VNAVHDCPCRDCRAERRWRRLAFWAAFAAGVLFIDVACFGGLSALAIGLARLWRAL
jgi:hypothetical protein